MLSTAVPAALEVQPSRASGVYRAGEVVTWSVVWDSIEDYPPPAVNFEVKMGGLETVDEGELVWDAGQATLTTRMEAPNTVLLELTWDEDGETRRERAGAVASPDQIEPAAEAPADFDAFWADKIAELSAVPMGVELEAHPSPTEEVEYWHVLMNNIRGTKIHGQLAKPAGGEKLPALLIVQWAGVYGLQSSWATDRAKEGWLTLNILPHDLPIDEPESFYAELKAGALSDYAGIGADDREQSYFLRMYLSCYRAVEYLKTRADWNGETLVVMGVSQGGQQTLVTAGLHPDVTAALALVPAGADMMAPAKGRAATFPNWYYKTEGRDAEAVHATSKYFDAANFAARIDVPVLLGIGLEDTVCPPGTIFAAANQIRSYREIVILPDSGHQNVNGSQEPYNDRAYQGWLPALRRGLPAPVRMTDHEAREHMKAQLGITQTRPGANPNDPDAPNAVNYDEAKANPFPELPAPLVFDDGTAVTNETDWRARRAEILEHFEREVYGRIPEAVPSVDWSVTESRRERKGDVAVVTRQLAGKVDPEGAYPWLDVEIDLTVSLPAEADGPVPLVLHLGWPQWVLAMFPRPPGPTWEEQVLAHGWGVATIMPTSYQADNGDGLTQGVIGISLQGQPRGPEDWGALRAWAWGASRAMDFFENDPGVDAERVTVEGLSRYGKAALVAMAFDERFAVGFIGSSGAGGAKLHRRNFGELVENLAGGGAHHWMAGNYVKYAGPLQWNDLPVDSHQLIAACAPRPVFVSAGAAEVEGQWIDQRGMFMATEAASPVYEFLGGSGLGVTEYPKTGDAVVAGDLAWRQHFGGHTALPNWPTFLEWAEPRLP